MKHQMSGETIRIAMAEACGWTSRLVPSTTNGADNPYCEPQWTWWKNPKGEEPRPLPDYCNDLNATNEAEKRFHANNDLAQKYAHELMQVVYKTKHSGTGIDFQWINATAFQRCIAFLKTLGHPVETPEEGGGE